ncbi:MAG TPA: DUF6064 family protein [Candidatus Cloacimonadota bacterium]|nr:DUF6064 family protein [Candidatus Cloacimonadota bacterium]HPT70985.1 DUF6064 family protein [Candidatus Cloacimonadota bacterium]
MLPFGSNDIFREFLAYNNSIWPMPIIGYALGLIAVISMSYENKLSDRMIALVLGFFWMWIGVMQQITFFSQIIPWANLFGILFIVQSFLILWFGVLLNRLQFRVTFSGYNLIGIIFIIYSLVAYPLIGFFTGHVYPSTAVFGIAASPTAIFTFGMFLFTEDQFPTLLLYIPLVWSLLGFATSMATGMHEDFALFVAGISCFWLTLLKNRKNHNKKESMEHDFD